MRCPEPQRWVARRTPDTIEPLSRPLGWGNMCPPALFATVVFTRREVQHSRGVGGAVLRALPGRDFPPPRLRRLLIGLRAFRAR
jgi:hypothetical protein